MARQTTRNLPKAVTTIFEQEESGDTGALLDRVADYLDDTGATLLSITYHNTLDGGYSERLIVTAEQA